MVRCLTIATCMLGLMFSAVGCYEGWEYERGDGNGDGELPDIEQPPKSLLYVLFEVFRLSSGAMDDASCFPAVSTKEYRSNEWAERVGSITTALQANAETVVVTNRDILPDDCLTLSAIESASLDSDPWAPQAGPGPDSLGLERSTVHLKAVLWDDDAAFATPSSQVQKVDWAAMEAFITGGEPGLSLHYFVMSTDSTGYLSEWRASLPEDVSLEGSPIFTIDPSPAGMEARSQTIANDTSELMQWILESAELDAL